jgi:hypothetical protein
MANKENLIGKGFETNPQNINKNGRPKKIYTILKEIGYSKEDIKTCFGELLWYNESDLIEIIKDKEKPIITQITAKALIEAKDKGEFNKIKEILEQTVGKPMQSIEVQKNEPLTNITITEV